MNGTVAVTGATGGVGGRVVARLSASRPVIALARVPSRVPPRPRVERRYADYDDPASLHSALAGVDRLVFIASDGAPSAMSRHHDHVLDAIARRSPSFVVYLGALGCAPGSPFIYAPVHRRTEKALAELRIPHAVARASVFTDFFWPWMRRAAETGELDVPAGDGRVALVSRQDVADALAAMIESSEPRHGILAGPRAHTMAEVCAILATAIRRGVRYRPTDAQTYRDLLSRRGHDPWVVDAYTSLFESIAQGRFDRESDHIERLTGRAPTHLESVVAHRYGYPTT